MLDACFMIGLRDCGKLALLPKVAKLLSWKLIIPEAAYAECTAKKSTSSQIKKLVSNKSVEVRQAPPDVLSKLQNRYANLGKGEIEALAFAVSCKEENDRAIVITSDQRPCKVASELGIQTLSTLDFFKKVYELGLMTKKEMYAFIPTLKNYMWLSSKVTEDFLDTLQ